MSDIRKIVHPLTRDGKSQSDRQDLRALSPDFAQLDGRDDKQLLAYLYEFAKAVIFENTDGSQDNWQAFFRSGSSVQLALIAQFDPETLRRDFDDAKMRFNDGLDQGNYAPLLDFLFESAIGVDRWHKALSDDTEFIDGQLLINENPLRQLIQNLIISNLQTALKQLMAVANSISDFHIAPLSIQYQLETDEAVKAKISEQINAARYILPSFDDTTQQLWELSPADFIARDTALQQAMATPLSFQTVAIERLTTLFSTFYKAVRQIITDTEGVSILQKTKMHEPHLGLLYAFLRLFSYVQGDLNKMSQRHLDFYFRQVLGLRPKTFLPDEAHLVFETDKPFATAKIVEKTLIKDGKDSQNAEIQFATTDELITTKAQIATLKTLHFGTFKGSDDKLNHKDFSKTTLFGAPIANSADGNGAPFLPNSDKTWAVLGATSFTVFDDKTADFVPQMMPTARLGLLIASPVLRLAEGTRAVTLTLETATSFPNIAIDSLFDIQFSGKKGWFTPDKAGKPTFQFDKTNLKIVINFGIKDEAVVVADPSVLKADFGVSEPLMRLIFNHDLMNGTESFYQILRDASLQNITLTATADKVANIIVQNNNGLLDPTKPFQPFGAQPKTGDYFYIGSDEVFRKNITDLTLNIAWKEILGDDYYKYYSSTIPKKGDFSMDIACLNQNIFDFKQNKPLFDSSQNLKNLENELLTAPSVLTQFIKDETREGFIRLTLLGDFLHSVYPDAAKLRAKVISDTNEQPPTMPNVPFVPTIQTLTLTYTAVDSKDNTTTDTAVQTLQVFHLYPFDETNRAAVKTGDGILPKFHLATETTVQKNIEGALFLGLRDANASETLTILFQLNEPSADAYLAAAKIEWSYLIDNQWVALRDGVHVLSDSTEGFIRSGIVRLVLPSDISAKNTTILPPQYLWLRAATDARSAATCRVIGVHTQAGHTIFQNQNNDLTRLDTPLVAGSVKKLAQPMAEVKSVAQPYDTFNGRAPETDAAFYVRTSERLRHKGRAATLSDYEQLVLAAFPDIYKVKCITHTLAERVSEGAKDKLLAPGHVTVVVVPNLTTRPLAERFEPKVSRGRLDDIADFLKTRTSPFVRLNVMNPIFERINTSAFVQFQSGKSPAFYKNQLELDLKQYFAPWAFDPKAKIEFGGQIFSSSILGFIEQRDYVDYIKNFRMSKTDTPSVLPENDVSVLTTSTARGIFVSGKHVITF